MATTAQDAANASSQNNKTEPKSLIQDKSLPNTTKETGLFLDSHDLAQFRNSALFAARNCQAEMKQRKELSEGLLAPVFNADPKKVEEFLAKPNVKKEMVLAKSCYREGYHSKKLNQFVCFRNWKNVSALQAAALCLDKFLVIKLLAPIVADDNLRLEAKKQLEEIKNRIVKENKVNREKVAATENNSSASAATDKAGNAPSIERKETVEKTQTTSADSSEYAAPIIALLKAYSDYLNKYELLDSKGGEWKDLYKLWDIIGSCHKRLPRYILQEIFAERCWRHDPKFTSEPSRGEFCYMTENPLDDTPFDLDGLGDGTMFGFYKGHTRTVHVCLSADFPYGGSSWALYENAEEDSTAIKNLYELRLADLKNIIDALKTPESALALVADGKSIGLKRS